MNTPGDRPVFFLHIPKTAGVSLVTLLQSKFDEAEVLVPPNHSADGITPEELDTYQFVALHAYAAYIERFARRPVVLTMLREPIDRALSHYYFMNTTPFERLPLNQQGPFKRAHESENLLDYLEKWPEDAAAQLGNLQVGFLSRADWVNQDFGKGRDPLELAKENLAKFEFVGILERFWESLSLLAYLFNWAPLEGGPRINVTARRPSVGEVDEKTLTLLKQLNELDLELYRTACTIFDERWAKMIEELLHRNAARFSADKLPRRKRLTGVHARPSNQQHAAAVSKPLPKKACLIRISGSIPPVLDADTRLEVPVVVKNLGGSNLVSAPPNPVRLSYHWTPLGGGHEEEGIRSKLPRAIPPSREVRAKVDVITPKVPGNYRLRVTLVQEHVRWFDSVQPANSWISEVTIKAAGAGDEAS
jgi:hypothetical protein